MGNLTGGRLKSADSSDDWTAAGERPIHTTTSQTGRSKKGRKRWKQSSRYRRTKQQLKDLERRKAAHRKSLQGHLANRVVRLGNQIHTEKVSYCAWQKQFGKSIQHHAPSAFEGILTRKAETLGGGTLLINTFQTALSQSCLCGNRKKKSLSERTHTCDACVVHGATRSIFGLSRTAYLLDRRKMGRESR